MDFRYMVVSSPLVLNGFKKSPLNKSFFFIMCIYLLLNKKIAGIGPAILYFTHIRCY